VENIRALFNSLEDMEAVAAILRQQGVIDIKLQSEENTVGNTLDSVQEQLSFTNGIADNDNEATSGTTCIMEIVVESSRFRQVEDTIARYGGIYEGVGLS
jgi:hypothetical protein